LNKKSVLAVLSHWIVELGKLDATLRKAYLKTFISRRSDSLRKPYAAGISRFPRRTVFAATVNKRDFLVDPTGNDRFWVLPVTSCDYSHEIDMQQLFAQIYQDYLAGAEWWLTDEESARHNQSNEAFEASDEVRDALTSHFDWNQLPRCMERGDVDWLTATDILRRCGVSNPNKEQFNRAAMFLQKLTGGPAKLRKIGMATGRFFPVPR
jgi:putative DNA primase/helicase